MGKFKKGCALSLALVIGISSLSGCAKEKKKTAKEIMEDAITEIGKVKSVNMDMEMFMDMKVTEDKEKSQFSIDYQLNIDQMHEDQLAHGKGTLSIESEDDESIDIETYICKEKKDLVNYTSLDGEWYIDDSESAERLFEMEDILKDFAKVKKLKVNGTGKINKTQTDIVQGKIKGDLIYEILAMSNNTNYLNSFINVSELDLDDCEAMLEIQFYSDTNRMASLKLTLDSDFEDALEDYYKENSYADDVKVKLKDYQIKYIFNEYNEVSKIKEPKDLDKDDVYEFDDEDDFWDDFEETEGVEDASGPWDTFAFKYNDKDYKLPLKYSELQAAGFEIDSASDKRLTIGSKEVEYFIYCSNDKGQMITATFYNDSDSSKPIAECMVVSISINSYDAEDMNFELPGGIRIGSTEKELNEKYSEFSSKISSSYYVRYQYAVEDFYKEVGITIDEDGIIYSIEITNDPSMDKWR